MNGEAWNDRDTSIEKGGDIVRKRASYSISRARIIREQHRPGSLSSLSLSLLKEREKEEFMAT